jgi:uncharacterized protein (TIGR03067 family)
MFSPEIAHAQSNQWFGSSGGTKVGLARYNEARQGAAFFPQPSSDTMRTATVLFAITWLMATGVRGQDNTAKEQKRLQGTWNFITFESDGKSQDRFKDAKAVVKGNRVTVMLAKFGKFTRTFKLFTDSTPCCVDFLNEDGKGDASEGIYELKDNSLKLLLNIRKGVKERPTTFADKGKSGHIYFVLKRQK